MSTTMDTAVWDLTDPWVAPGKEQGSLGPSAPPWGRGKEPVSPPRLDGLPETEISGYQHGPGQAGVISCDKQGGWEPRPDCPMQPQALW